MNRKLLVWAVSSVIAFGAIGTVAAQDSLLIDFNSTSQDNGPHPQEGYQSYDAAHETPADFTTMEYFAFGTEVTVTPRWPDSTDARTMQMIDRGGNHDAFWVGEKVDLLTDWIGVDTRTDNGGNGNFNFEEGGVMTRIELALGGLPPGQYNWISYHHDTEWIHADFFVELSVDGGLNYSLIETPLGEELFTMTSSNNTGGNPPAEVHYQGDDDPDPILLPSTVILDFEKPPENQNDDVVFRFTPIAHTAVHTQLVGINGFELYLDSPPPVDGDFDDNGLYECADIDALYAGIGTNDASLDLTEDGTVNGDDVTAWLTEAGTELGYTGAIPSGDADLNGVVGAGDLNVVGINWQANANSWCSGDFNYDGSVNAPDLNEMGVNWLVDVRSAEAAAVPEPSGWAMVLPAIVLFSLRRRLFTRRA